MNDWAYQIRKNRQAWNNFADLNAAAERFRSKPGLPAIVHEPKFEGNLQDWAVSCLKRHDWDRKQLWGQWREYSDGEES